MPKSITPLQFLVTSKDIQDREQEAAKHSIVSKYASIDSLQKADKVKALKDPTLNPFLLNNPTDGLSNSFERWKTVAWSADEHSRKLGEPADVEGKGPSAYKMKVASGYYDKILAPLYAAAKIQPMSKELWMKQAYNEGLNYNIEDAYNNSIVHQLKHGLDEGLASTARAYGFMTNVAGHVIDSVVDTWRKQQAFRAMPDRVRKAMLEKGTDFNNPQIQAVWARTEQERESMKWYYQVGKQQPVKTDTEHPSNLKQALLAGADIQSAKHDFWAQALPEYDGWFNHATSFVAEQVGQAPIYAAMELGMIPLREATLTKSLMSSPMGAKVIPYLMAGTEGTAYGVLTRPQGDKLQSWKDAAGMMIFHGLFDVAGMGTKKLIDMFKDDSPTLEELHRRQNAYVLAQEGKRKATPAEQYQEHVKEVSNNLAVGGVGTQRAIFIEALTHVQEMEGMAREQVQAHESDLLKRDPAHAAPMLASAKLIKSILREQGTTLKGMSEIDFKVLSQRLAKVIFDAGSSMNENVIKLEDQIAPKVEEQVKTAGGKKTFEFYKAQEIAVRMKEDPVAFEMLKPEQIDALAKRRMVVAEKRAAILAERELKANPVKDAERVAKKVTASSVKQEAQEALKRSPAVKVRSERTVNKYGEPAVRYSVNPEYKVQLGMYQKSAKTQGKTLAEFFKDMPDEDFARDLNTHFFPKALRDSGVFFEHQNTREGMQNPNFLGFMYNYIDKMPEEFGKELEERLVDTLKVQKFMNGKKPTEPQLMYFARAMWNHVDNFLGSGRWPKESNIFRSTQDEMWTSTKWQRQLLKERMDTEKRALVKAFSRNGAAGKAALTAYNLLAAERLAQYKTGPTDMLSQEYIKMLSERAAKIFTDTGKFEKVVF